MMTKTNQQFPCVLCTDRKSLDAFTIMECSQTFCAQHINEHKQIVEPNLISKLDVCTTTHEIFDMFAGDLRIEDNGQVVVHGSSVAHACVQGNGKYSSGKHRFQFKIESYNINKWIFFGIISHKATMQSRTWAIPTSYGWGGQDSVILNCAVYAGFNNYTCDFELNDTIELLLDCDDHIINLTNQRTNRTHKINIDLVKCPFPWHFCLNFFYPNDQVRILRLEN